MRIQSNSKGLSMSDNSDLKGDLEYNDGLGDLLREKERLEFSWVKTIVSLIVILGAVYIAVNFLFKFSKSIIEDSVTVKYAEPAPAKPVIPEVKPEPKQEVAKPATPAKTVQETPVVSKPTPKEPEKATVSNSTHPYKVIVGSFVSKTNANELKKKLQQQGFDSFIWTTKQGSETLYRVQSGAYETRQLAKNQKKALSKKGFDSYILQK